MRQASGIGVSPRARPRRSLRPPVRRVAVGRDQQRNVVASRWIRDADANDDEIQKGGITRCNARAAEVITNAERQLIHAALESTTGGERSVGAALGIGRRAPNRRALVAADDMRLDEHPAGGHSARCVEYVDRRPSGHDRVSVRPSTPYGAAGSMYTPNSSPRS